MKSSTLLFLLFGSFSLMSQLPERSIHQEQQEFYNAKGHSFGYYEEQNKPSTAVQHEKSNCNLEKIVFGWHPFWSNGLQVNYDWDLLSDFSYFSYEVDPNTGNALTTHGFSTAQAVTDALNNGVRVNLCVTLFNDHDTFLSDPNSRQTLINNLISLVQNRGAHGVNIDFESMPSSVSADYTAFMIDLCTQMHNQIPGSQVSIAMHAVDWSGFYDIAALEPHVDLFCIMGYDYYWSGSANAGPNDPLFHFQNTYNYTLSKSTTYYRDQGVPPSKLILGLPYYGREWDVSSHNLPATTTSNGSPVFYNEAKDNVSGNYSTANRNYEPESRSVYYNFFDGGTPVQCFISEEDELGERMDFINQRGLAGMGIWALGYDDGYNELWNEIEGHFTDCSAAPCTGTFYDAGGGPFKDYYNNENYSFTIAPENAVSLDISFSSFDLEQGFDYLYVYDGNDTNAPQIAGSPFSGTAIPPNFNTSSGAVTFRFTSDGSTVAGGFEGTYTCTIDETDPLTTVDPAPSNNWQTEDFNQDFNDLDDANGTGIHKAYYHVGQRMNGYWKANEKRGFFNDHFDDAALLPEWESANGNWTETTSSTLLQTDESLGNTNVWARLNQSLSNHHVYHWKGKMSGSGSNRRAGLHIFCSDSVATNRGDSYFVWFRLDDDRVQFYKVENDVFGAPVVNNAFNFQENVWYDFKLIYDRIDGGVWIYVDDELVGQWTDSAPIPTGKYISLRSGNAGYEVDSLTVFRSRYPAATIKVGNDSLDDIQVQNSDPSTPAGRVMSIVKDNADNLSAIDEVHIDVDWTPPHHFYLNDGNVAGVDQDTIYNNQVLQAHAHWSVIDTHSLMNSYAFAIGSQPYEDDIVAWTPNAQDTAVLNVTSSDFVAGDWYYFSLRSENNAGLIDSVASDGFRLVPSASLNEEVLSIPKVYPNPATDQTTVSAAQPIERVSIYDMNGKRLLTQDVHAKSAVIDVNDLSAGLYVLRVTEKNQQIELKLIVD
ncbi:MAG: glycosyl hydrolase family 18 protein [Bacteroidota bacterium]